MIWAWTAGMLAGLLLLLLVPVHLEINYRQEGEGEILRLAIGLPGEWGRWEVEFPPPGDWWPEEVPPQAETRLQETPEAMVNRQGRRWTAGRLARFCVTGPLGYWLHKIKILKDIVHHFLARVTCHRLRLFLSLGTGEPATTALLYGSAWAVLALGYQNLRRRAEVGFTTPEWQVLPRFDRPGWEASFNCIFTFRLGHIIIAGLRTLQLIAITVWQVREAGSVARTSHRGLDEDRHGKHQGYG